MTHVTGECDSGHGLKHDPAILIHRALRLLRKLPQHLRVTAQQKIGKPGSGVMISK
jgi:hypothetical protein